MGEGSVLVTGGAGYIGSHAVKRLLTDGRRVVVVDNLYRGHRAAIDRLADIGHDRLHFEACDIADQQRIEGLMRDHDVRAVMHFAALAYVGESVNEPLTYYRNNTAAALALIEACKACDVRRFVFSSTCATYGEPAADQIPIRETCPQSPINPYGQSKLVVEHMLKDYAASADQTFGFAALRYFNVAGCDREGVVGEHHEPETHLIPVILHAILGIRDKITIFGTDYDTPDGTCIRDYIHVEDLVDAHVRVLENLGDGDQRFYNLGIGNGYSVREIIDAVRRVTGRSFDVDEGPRRAGDPPVLFADPSRIRDELGWSAQITSIDDIVASAWAWFEAHPTGYTDAVPATDR